MLITIVNIILALTLGPKLEAVINPWGVAAITAPASELSPVIKDYRSAVFSPLDRAFLLENEADIEQPIASITKLMTALIFIETNPRWEEIYQIKTEDNVTGGRLNLFLGDSVTIRDLFFTSLVASDNGATLALVHASGLSETEFVARMNLMAQKLGLKHTRFIDSVGLSDGNISTAREVAHLAVAAFKRPEIREATLKKIHIFTTLEGREKKVESTDNLLFNQNNKGLKILGGKTGYTPLAGYCFVGLFAEASGRELISVVLNNQDRNERFTDSRYLADWIFNNYIWYKNYSL